MTAYGWNQAEVILFPRPPAVDVDCQWMWFREAVVAQTQKKSFEKTKCKTWCWRVGQSVG